MGTLHDILFVGTTHGRLLKLSSDSHTLIEAIQVFPYHVPVRNILVSDDQIIIFTSISNVLISKNDQFLEKNRFNLCNANMI